jgi:hypothetical protein
VVALDPGHADGLPVDRVVGGLDAAGMAALYDETDVLVKLSRVESLGLAPLEAFHRGVPCIVTPYTGHEEYAVHGVNGAVVGFDDPRGVTGWLDRLARDRDLLARLSEGARATAARWPDAEAATATLARGLREFESGPPPAHGPALGRTVRRAIETGREQLRQREAELLQLQGDLAYERDRIDGLNALVEELEHSRRHVNELLLKAEADLEEIRSSRAYRATVAARRVVRRGG